MITLGIDLSLTSPSLCLHEGGDFTFNACKFFYISGVKKSVITDDVLNGTLWPEYSSDEERYGIVSEWVIDTILKHNVDNVFIEGYAFNAVGRVFQIAENTGILKYKIWRLGIPCVTVPPTVIKKFATGKGNANKELINEFFVKETCTDLKSKLKLTSKQWNPSSDIIDSYYVCKYGVYDGKKV